MLCKALTCLLTDVWVVCCTHLMLKLSPACMRGERSKSAKVELLKRRELQSIEQPLIIFWATLIFWQDLAYVMSCNTDMSCSKSILCAPQAPQLPMQLPELLTGQIPHLPPPPSANFAKTPGHHMQPSRPINVTSVQIPSMQSLPDAAQSAGGQYHLPSDLVSPAQVRGRTFAGDNDSCAFMSTCS